MSDDSASTSQEMETLLANAASHSTGRIVIVWPQSMHPDEARKRMFLLGFSFNITASDLLSSWATFARANTYNYITRAGATINQCKSMGAVMVFDSHQLSTSIQEGIKTEGGRGGSVRILPEDGSVLYASRSRKNGGLTASLYGLEQDVCALIYLDGTYISRTCTLSFTIPLPRTAYLSRRTNVSQHIITAITINTTTSTQVGRPIKVRWWFVHPHSTKSALHMSHHTNATRIPRCETDADLCKVCRGACLPLPRIEYQRLNTLRARFCEKRRLSVSLPWGTPVQFIAATAGGTPHVYLLPPQYPQCIPLQFVLPTDEGRGYVLSVWDLARGELIGACEVYQEDQDLRCSHSSERIGTQCGDSIHNYHTSDCTSYDTSDCTHYHTSGSAYKQCHETVCSQRHEGAANEVKVPDGSITARDKSKVLLGKGRRQTTHEKGTHAVMHDGRHTNESENDGMHTDEGGHDGRSMNESVHNGRDIRAGLHDTRHASEALQCSLDGSITHDTVTTSKGSQCYGGTDDDHEYSTSTESSHGSLNADTNTNTCPNHARGSDKHAFSHTRAHLQHYTFPASIRSLHHLMCPPPELPIASILPAHTSPFTSAYAGGGTYCGDIYSHDYAKGMHCCDMYSQGEASSKSECQLYPDNSSHEDAVCNCRMSECRVISKLKARVGGMGGDTDDMLLDDLRTDTLGYVNFTAHTLKPPRSGTTDWLYARAVGPAVVAGVVRRLAPGLFQVSFNLRYAGEYALELVKSWRGLPMVLAVGRQYAEANTASWPHAVYGMVGRQADVVRDLSQETALVGHVTVFHSCKHTRLHTQRESGEGGDLNEQVHLSEQDHVNGQYYEHTRQDKADSECDGVRAGAWVHSMDMADRGIDECGVVEGEWRWKADACEDKRFWSDQECVSCVRDRGFKHILFMGDSHCRDIYVEVVTCALQDKDPEVSAARQVTKHSNCSVPLPEGGFLDFIWTSKAEQIMDVLEGYLISRQNDPSSQHDRVAIVVGFGIWEMVVHQMPLEQFLKISERIASILRQLQEEFNVRAVWLTPMARTQEKRGVLPGETDVRIGSWRTRHWVKKGAAVFKAHNIAVVDQFHPSDVLPEAFDGVHIGIACAWGQLHGSHAPGTKGICRYTGRIIARAVLNTLLDIFCPPRRRPPDALTHTCVLKLSSVNERGVAESAHGVPIVSQAYVSVLSVRGTPCAAGEDAADRAAWPTGAVGEIVVSWCSLCFPGSHAHVSLNEDRIGKCATSTCKVPLRGVLSGAHVLQVDISDKSEDLVSQTIFHLNFPRLSEALETNLALQSNGGRAIAAYTQGGFDILTAIDGVTDGDMNGWSYYGRLPDAKAIFIFDHIAVLHRIMLISGASRTDHHITRFVLHYSTDPSPSLEAQEVWMPIRELCENQIAGSDGVRCIGEGEYAVDEGIHIVELHCDELRASAIRLQVLASDAMNGNAVLTELAAFGI